MKRTIFFIACFLFVHNLLAHEDEAKLKDNSRIFKGGFGELHYNQPIGKNPKHNGHLDVHRLVVGMGYAFSEKCYFFGEVAYEHVSEVLIEQVYINYEINHSLNIKAGLIPVPMGIVNQEHEPNMFNGVEHPATNLYITPTAWRELGIGIHGNLEAMSLSYQLYLINGFSSYKDDEGKATGEKAFREARQEGVASFISHPNIAARLEFHGIPNLKLGISTYLGKTQSELYDNASKTVADSTVLKINMFGIDAHYENNGWQMRTEFMYNNISNTEAYNTYTQQDLGSANLGYYAELGYNIFATMQKETALIPFVRYAKYDTHHKVSKGILRNKAYERELITTGLTYFMNKNIIIKADYQKVTDGKDSSHDMFNFGINFIF